MSVYWLQHVPFEGLGRIEDWFVARGVTPKCVRLYAGDVLPPVEEVDFLIVMGGPMSVNDEEAFPWLTAEKEFIREVILKSVPVFGVCLGSQLIASVLGAEVYPAKEKEIGWWPLRVTADEASNTLFPDASRVFHWHGETFDLPKDAELLASTASCENQAFRVGDKVVGTQFHIETTAESAKALVENCGDELVDRSSYVQSAEEILSTPEENYRRIEPFLDQVLSSLWRSGGFSRRET
ncbi:MAG: type 1 glutamine amidotransferase [Verrucomicrobiota bacterium]